MENIFFILGLLVLFKWVFSLFLISRNFKKTSYLIEVVVSLAIFTVLYIFKKELYFAIVFAEIEYFFSKIVVLVLVLIIKTIAFKLLVSILRKTVISKLICIIFDKKILCYKLRNWQNVNYGPRLKQGIPGMAKRKHRKSQIKFNRNGFPIFKAIYTYHLPIKEWRKSRETHFFKANKELYEKAMKSRRIKKLFTKKEMEYFKKGNTPPKYTWHHHQNRGKMQLVLREIHSSVEHIGGYSIWGPK